MAKFNLSAEDMFEVMQVFIFSDSICWWSVNQGLLLMFLYVLLRHTFSDSHYADIILCKGLERWLEPPLISLHFPR